MIRKELTRVTVVQQLMDGLHTTKKAAQILGLSERQVKRLKKGLVNNGPSALPHGNRGRSPAHTIPESVLQVLQSSLLLP